MKFEDLTTKQMSIVLNQLPHPRHIVSNYYVMVLNITGDALEILHQGDFRPILGSDVVVFEFKKVTTACDNLTWKLI